MHQRLDHPDSYYAASANASIERPVLQGALSCDVCVIGAGYTGLSSAIALAEMGYRVIVLEAARVGYGASGRNGGQIVNSYSRDMDVIEHRYGKEEAQQLGAMGGWAVAGAGRRRALAGGAVAAFGRRGAGYAPGGDVGCVFARIAC